VKPGENHHDKLCECMTGAMLKSKTRKCEKKKEREDGEERRRRKKTVGKKNSNGFFQAFRSNFFVIASPIFFFSLLFELTKQNTKIVQGLGQNCHLLITVTLKIFSPVSGI